MAKQMKAKVSLKLWKNVKTAVTHYIREQNTLDCMEEFHGFSTSYRSNVTAYVAFVEDNTRFSQSLIEYYESHVPSTMIMFACEASVKAYVNNHLEKCDSTTETIASNISAIQKWIDNVEPEHNRFVIRSSYSINRSVEKQKAVRKNAQKNRFKYTDVITQFKQRTMSIDSETKINKVTCNYQDSLLTLESSMLFAIEFKLVQSTWVRNKTLKTFFLENILVDYERGPYSLFPKNEIIAIFGYDYNEPARIFLIPPFGTKKNEDDFQLAGMYRHKCVENCGWFLTCMTVFYIMVTDVKEEFNFYVDKEIDNDSKFSYRYIALY